MEDLNPKLFIKAQIDNQKKWTENCGDNLQYRKVWTNDAGTHRYGVSSNKIMRDDSYTAAYFFIRKYLGMVSDKYWIGWDKKEKFDCICVEEQRYKSNVIVLAN